MKIVTVNNRVGVYDVIFEDSSSDSIVFFVHGTGIASAWVIREPKTICSNNMYLFISIFPVISSHTYPSQTISKFKVVLELVVVEPVAVARNDCALNSVLPGSCPG